MLNYYNLTSFTYISIFHSKNVAFRTNKIFKEFSENDLSFLSIQLRKGKKKTIWFTLSRITDLCSFGKHFVKKILNIFKIIIMGPGSTGLPTGTFNNITCLTVSQCKFIQDFLDINLPWRNFFYYTAGFFIHCQIFNFI